MDEEIMRIFKPLFSLVGISALAAASRSLLSPDRRSLPAFFRGLVLACFVGGVVGLSMQDSDLTPSIQGAVVGISGFVADDLLLALVAFTTKLREDPMAVVNAVIDWIVKFRTPK